MQRHNSFTSNSDPANSELPKNFAKAITRHRIGSWAKIGVGFLATLAAFDLGINALFPYPSDPLDTSPGALNLYFDYGRSIEGKVTRQLGATDETSAPIARAGWIDANLQQQQATEPAPNSDMLVALYGMSFARQMGEAMQTLDPKLTLRFMGGPAAAPSYTFAAYQADRGHHQADVVVLGLLASSVKGMGAMTGMTWGAEVPAPYTFPKYQLENGQLVAIEPEIRSLAELRAAQQNPEKWQSFERQLQQHDQFFDAFSFEKNGLDASATVRLVRRAWAKSHQDSITNQIHSAAGFNPEWEQAPVLKRLIEEFAASAKQDGKLPVVVLFNDQGYEDHLYQLLQATLTANQIPYISTHEIAPASDRSNFVGDGHFTPAANQRIAQQALALIREKAQPAPAK